MNIKDCKCGAKYVKGLPAIDNGQILIGEQYVCTECWNRDIEQNLARLEQHADAMSAKLTAALEKLAPKVTPYSFSDYRRPPCPYCDEGIEGMECNVL